MFFNFALLIVLGIICLILTVIALIFGVVALSNNKPSKFIWFILFLVGFFGLIFCVIFSVKKAATAVSHFSEQTIEQFESYADSLSQLEDIDQYQSLESSSHIELLKSYLDPNMLNHDPVEFYTYLGFKDYYRYPLKYPYSIHSMYEQSNGELFNEINVSHFDENDNGELFLGISYIQKIAFDKNYLLIEQAVVSKHSDQKTLHYILYNMNNDKQETASSFSKLLKMAKTNGYNGPNTLMTLAEYRNLFGLQ